MEIYLDQIPEGVDVSDYPEGTWFILDDSPLQRDPVTFQLIKRPRRPLIYPEDVRKMENSD